MLSPSRLFLALGALTLLLATVLGAYGTHALRDAVTAAAWDAYAVGVDYQFYHGLGLVAVALTAERYPRSTWIAAAGWLMLGGIVLFCGSIYATTFGASGVVGAAAPIGGLCLMLGWLALALGALNGSRAG